MWNMGDYSREESIFGFSGPVTRIVAAAILLVAITVALTKIRAELEPLFDPAVVAAFAKIPFEEPRDIAKKNQTSLLFASPPVPSLHQVASVLSPQS